MEVSGSQRKTKPVLTPAGRLLSSRFGLRPGHFENHVQCCRSCSDVEPAIRPQQSFLIACQQAKGSLVLLEQFLGWYSVRIQAHQVGHGCPKYLGELDKALSARKRHLPKPKLVQEIGR